MKLSERALIHAGNMQSEGWYTTANVLAECAEALEGGDAEAWHHCVEVIMTMAGLSCSLSPTESMIEFQSWLSAQSAPSVNSPHNSGEVDPSVTPDCLGADTKEIEGASRDTAQGLPVGLQGESRTPAPSTSFLA